MDFSNPIQALTIPVGSTYNACMKAIQVLFDENLLAELDATKDVRENGRSAVLRQIARDFIRDRRREEIDTQYERAYSGVRDPLGKDFEGWEEEGVWPPE